MNIIDFEVESQCPVQSHLPFVRVGLHGQAALHATLPQLRKLGEHPVGETGLCYVFEGYFARCSSVRRSGRPFLLVGHTTRTGRGLPLESSVTCRLIIPEMNTALTGCEPLLVTRPGGQLVRFESPCCLDLPGVFGESFTEAPSLSPAERVALAFPFMAPTDRRYSFYRAYWTACFSDSLRRGEQPLLPTWPLLEVNLFSETQPGAIQQLDRLERAWLTHAQRIVLYIDLGTDEKMDQLRVLAHRRGVPIEERHVPFPV